MMLTGIPYGAQPEDTAEYMLGDVLVTVVLMESNGVTDASTEDWTAGAIDAVKAKVQEGMQWWEDALANFGPWLQNPTPTPVHSLNFILDFQYADIVIGRCRDGDRLGCAEGRPGGRTGD